MTNTTTTTKNEIRSILLAHLDTTLVTVTEQNDYLGLPTGRFSVTLRSNFVVRKAALIDAARAARRDLAAAGYLFSKGKLSYTTHYGAKADDLYLFTVGKAA